MSIDPSSTIDANPFTAQARRDQMVGELELLKVENDLGRLERRWQSLQTKYLFTDSSGRLYSPNPRTLVFTAALAIFSLLGLASACLASGTWHPGEGGLASWGLLAVLLIATSLAVWRAGNEISRAREYQNELDTYETKRSLFLRLRRELHRLV